MRTLEKVIREAKVFSEPTTDGIKYTKRITVETNIVVDTETPGLSPDYIEETLNDRLIRWLRK